MGRVLALDVGDVRVGVAVSDGLGITAQGLPTMERAAWHKDLAKLRALAAEHEIERVVIGLPRSLNGTLGPQAEKVKAYAEKIHDGLGLPVEMVDERLTTRAAHAALSESGAGHAKRKASVDRMAATLILQTYLETERRKGVTRETES